MEAPQPFPTARKSPSLIVPDRRFAPEVPPDRSEQLNQLLTWMERDLIELFQKTGYLATHGEEASASAAANRYLLRVQVMEYEGVSRAARLFAEAARAGTARLKAHFELIGPGDALVTSGDPSETGAVDWAKAARRVNRQTVRAVNGWIRLEH